MFTRAQQNYAAYDSWAACKVLWELQRKFSSEFSREAIATIVKSQMEVPELTSRFRQRKAARKVLNNGEFEFMSEEAKPWREQLEMNRPQAVPVWNLPIVFKMKSAKKGGSGGGGAGTSFDHDNSHLASLCR